jgi:hypothetical protein
MCLVLSAAVAGPAIAGPRFDDGLAAVLTTADPLRTALDRGFEVRDGRLQVVAVTDGVDPRALEEWLHSRGALFVLSVGERVQAFVAPSTLSDLGHRPGVVFVERPHYAELPEPAPEAASPKQTTLAVTSEGIAPMNVAAWHSAGFTGAGVRVGVIDVEFGGWDDLLGIELPPADRTTYRAFGGSSIDAGRVHGTACAEIVHDIAPDAHLFLAHIRTLNDLYASLDWLAGQGVDVVTISVGWYGTGPGDGTGRISDEITAFVAASDALFFASAGNERRSHWQGPTADADGDDWVDFAPGDNLNELSFTMADGDRVAVNITWDDWSSPTSDYSLHLFNLDGSEPVEVAASDRPQTGETWQTPFEQISYTAAGGGRFGVRVNRAGVAGTNDLELFSLDSDLENRVAEGSITIPGDVGEVIAAASVNYNAPHTYRSFSSAGPANGPGGSFQGGLTKPDLSGYDGVSTVSYGTRGFFGTSSASPHGAGAAALVREAEPSSDRADIRTFLETRALDLGPSGMDNDYGWGRIFLGPSPGSDCSYSVDPESITVSAAGGGGILQVAADEGCPWSTSSSVDWITLAPASGTGDGVVGYTVDANTGPVRSTEIVIGGLSVPVSQAGIQCDFALSPVAQSFPATGGSGLFTVQTDAGCPWTASTGQSWITLTAASGSGPGSVVFNVAAHEGVDQRNGSINVAGQSFTVNQDGLGNESVYLVAGIAETEGAAQTRWKSDLAILNPGDVRADIDLRYHHDQGTALTSLSVEPGSIVELANVAVETFNAPGTAGAVELVSSTELIVTARTFNDAPTGTFGQFLPGVEAIDGLTGAGTAVLSQLNSGSGFRTNIGFVDLGGTGAVARIRLYDGDGERVGSQIAEIVPPAGWSQRNRVFQGANAGSCSGCYALVDLSGSGGPIWAYASVVDNSSGDPTTVPMVIVEPSELVDDQRLLVAGIAETGGAAQTRWKSNLALLNLSGATVVADLTYRHSGGDAEVSLTLVDGELVELEDVAGEFFGEAGTAGSVEVASDAPLVVTARTFNDSPTGTFGQFLPGVDEDSALANNEDGFLNQLKSTEDFRTNIGFTNYGSSECIVRTTLHDAGGALLRTIFTRVPAGGWSQENRVFQSVCADGCLGYAVTRSMTSGCRVWTYGSVVDNASGDPTTVPVVIR